MVVTSSINIFARRLRVVAFLPTALRFGVASFVLGDNDAISASLILGLRSR
jgi:hypothetical protein